MDHETAHRLIPHDMPIAGHRFAFGHHRPPEVRPGAPVVLIHGTPPDIPRAHFRSWFLSTVEDPSVLEDGPLDYYLDIICGPVGQASPFQHQIAHYDPRHTGELTDRLPALGQSRLG